MGMGVDVERTFVPSVPFFDREMEQDNLPAIVVDLIVWAAPVTGIMVPSDPHQISIQLLQYVWCVLMFVREVAQVVDRISLPHDTVPAPYHLGIHFLNSFKRPVRQADDILVSPVGASDIKLAAHLEIPTRSHC